MAHYFRPVVDANWSDTTKDGAAGVAWARSTTTITITATLGSLAVGDIVAITNSSDTDALPNGDYAVGAIGSGTFDITGFDTGAASGTTDWTAYVWYDAASAGNKHAGKPTSSNDVTITRQTCALSGNEAAASVAINASRTLDLATYNLAVTGATAVSGTLKIGVSADTGLTTAGLTINTGGKGNFQTGSKINNSSNFAAPAEAWMTASNRGTYNQTGSGTYVNATSSLFYSFTISGGTLTIGTSSFLTGPDGGKEFVMSDSAVLSLTASAYIGASASVTGHNITIGSGCDITGAGAVLFYATSTNYVNNRATAFSLTGTAGTATGSGVLNLTMPAWDFSNANVLIDGSSSASDSRIITAGTLKCKNLTTRASGTTPFTVSCSTGNPSFVVTGNIAFDQYTTWTRGTGTWDLSSASSTTMNTNAQAIGAVTKSGAGTRTLAGNSQVKSLAMTAGTIDVSTFNLISEGATALSNAATTLKIGVSAGTGFTTAGLTFNTGTLGDFQTTSKINNSANFTAPNPTEAWMVNSVRGTYNQTGSGTFLNKQGPGGPVFWSFTISGGTMTVSTTSFVTGPGSKEFVMSDAAVLNLTAAAWIGASSSAGNNFTIGAGCDITGDGILYFYGPAVNYVNSRATAFSFTGTVGTALGTTADLLTIPAWDFSNASVVVNGSASAASTRFITAGTLKCVNLSTLGSGSNLFTVNCYTYNPSFVVTGNISLDAYTLWLRGGGTITLGGSGGTQTIAGGNQIFEAITVAAAGATKSLTDNFSTLSLSGTGGIVQSSSAGTRRVMTAINQGVCTGMSFKDISMGFRDKIQAKSTCVNLGNNLGIVFKDVAGVNMSRTSPFRTGLDQFTNAVAAYGMNRLRIGYAGNSCRVRRSSDNAELDIGFNTNGTLNETALLTHCGLGDGFVTTWYDQIDSYNATQTTAAKQPQTVAAGVVVRTLTGPAHLRFDRVDDALGASLPNATDYTVVSSSWNDVQLYTIKTRPTGATFLPAGITGYMQGISGHSLVYYASAPSSNIISLLKQRNLPDLSSTDLFRLKFHTAGAKTLTVTESSSGISYVDQYGTQSSASYSRTVLSFDWLVVRAVDATKITVIDWNTKTLCGNLPQTAFSGLTKLTSFICYGNQLTGSIPSLAANTLLTNFQCFNNQLTGSIPDLSANTLLTTFHCYTNQLTGSIPSLTANTALTSFWCSANSLTGSIPSLTTNTQLNLFYCYSNSLTGTIPSLTVNTLLNVFYCHLNQLTGSIPDLSANTALTIFKCSYNQLMDWTGGTVSGTLGTFEATSNLLTVTAVNAILAAFRAAGRVAGTRILDLSGVGNAAPTGQGLTDKSYLQTTMGWTVTTN